MFDFFQGSECNHCISLCFFKNYILLLYLLSLAYCTVVVGFTTWNARALAENRSFPVPLQAFYSHIQFQVSSRIDFWLMSLFKDDCRSLDLEDDIDINLLIQIQEVTKHQKSQDQTGHIRSRISIYGSRLWSNAQEDRRVYKLNFGPFRNHLRYPFYLIVSLLVVCKLLLLTCYKQNQQSPGLITRYLRTFLRLWKHKGRWPKELSANGQCSPDKPRRKEEWTN